MIEVTVTVELVYTGPVVGEELDEDDEEVEVDGEDGEDREVAQGRYIVLYSTPHPLGQ